MKPEPATADTALSTRRSTVTRSSWLKRVLIVCFLLALLLIAAVLALPYTLPWLLQTQGIDFQWKDPQWQRDGFSVSQLQLTLPGDDARSRELQLENVRIYWAWNRYPIQRLQAARLQAHWPLTGDQAPASSTIKVPPAAFLTWLPQRIELRQIDANLPGVGSLQGSIDVRANAQGQLWQPAVVQTHLTLKDLQGPWLHSIPTDFRPTQLHVQIDTHPDHTNNTIGQQLLTINAHSEGAMRMQLDGRLELQQMPDWQGTLKDAELVVQLDMLENSALRAENLQAHATLNAHADSERFTVNLMEQSDLKVNTLQIDNIGHAEKTTLQLAGLSVQGRLSTPYQIEVNGPVIARLEELSTEQLQPQSWDLTGTFTGQLNHFEIIGNLIGQHGLNVDSHIRFLENTAQGSVSLKEMSFQGGNPLAKTLKSWPESVSLTSGKLRSQIDFSVPITSTDLINLSVRASTSDLDGTFNRSQLKKLDLDFNGQFELGRLPDWNGSLKDAQLAVQLGTLVHPGFSAEQLRTQTKFSAHSDSDGVAVNFSNDVALEAHRLRFPNAGQAEKVTVNLSDLVVQSRDHALDQIDVRSALNAQIGQLNAKSLHNQNWDFHGTLDGRLPQLELTGTLTGQYGLSLNNRIRFLDNTLQGNVTIKEIFFKAGNPLRKTFKDWPELLTFDRGRLHSKIDFRIPSSGTFNLSINGSANGLSGIINRSELKNSDIQFDVHLSGRALKLNIPILSIEHIDPGISLDSIRLANARYRATLDNPLHGVAEWESVQANLLNGRIWLNSQKLDLSQPSKVLLQIDGLELQKLFEVYPAEGLAGTGIIDGQLPIHIEADALYVKAGHLQARQPGVLQFHSDKIQALGKSNPAMRIVADALENFHFDLLSSALSYDQSGKLLLNIRLEGKNPKVEKGRPIHLNVNLEEDIPALLASIQLSGQVSEVIQKRVRQRLEKR